MSKKRFVLASVVMVALSASVYAVPINIVDDNSKASNSVAIDSNSTVKNQFNLAVGHYVNVNAAKGLAVGSYNTLSEKAIASGVFGQGKYGKTLSR